MIYFFFNWHLSDMITSNHIHKFCSSSWVVRILSRWTCYLLLTFSILNIYLALPSIFNGSYV